MKKRFTAILAVAVMAVTLLAGTVTASAAEEGESFKIGFLDQSGEAPPVVRMREIIRDVVEAAGGELICDTSNEDSAEAQVNACEKLISAGVKGIIMTRWLTPSFRPSSTCAMRTKSIWPSRSATSATKI